LSNQVFQGVRESVFGTGKDELGSGWMASYRRPLEDALIGRQIKIVEYAQLAVL
jgi:hypothetical protein